MDALRTELQRRTADLAAPELLRRMGYPKPGETTIRRLQDVLNDPDLGLSSGGFDFRYGSRDFLCTLCDVVGISEVDYLPVIDAREQWLREERVAFKPYIFIDTGFRRSDRPGTAIFALAASEGLRRIRFPHGFWRKPLAEQTRLAQRRVKKFMAETNGDVKVWGTAKRFLFFHAEDAAIVISPSGKVQGKHHGPVPSQASLQVGNQPISTQPPTSDTDD